MNKLNESQKTITYCVARVKEFGGCPGYGDFIGDGEEIDRTVKAAEWAIAHGYKENQS